MRHIEELISNIDVGQSFKEWSLKTQQRMAFFLVHFLRYIVAHLTEQSERKLLIDWTFNGGPDVERIQTHIWSI